MDEFVTPSGTAECTYEVKKSRFIATAAAASSRPDAMDFLQTIHQKYPDAGHHCWAYLLGNPATAASAATSDDGEPSGTAGKPILNVLNHSGVGDVMVVVSRYFGGVKLGAGGLVRAYSKAAQQVMDALPLQTHRVMVSKTLDADFSVEQPLRHWLANNNGVLQAIGYGEKVTITLSIPLELEADFQRFAEANGCQINTGY